MQLAAVTCNQKSLFLKKFQKNLAILKELKADNKRRQTKRQKKGIKREAKSCKEMEQYERLFLCFFYLDYTGTFSEQNIHTLTSLIPQSMSQDRYKTPQLYHASRTKYICILCRVLKTERQRQIQTVKIDRQIEN